jgi:enoyl-CoA hydratase/carnithine racemase
MPDLIIHIEGSVTVFTLNRPARHNALTPSLMKELEDGMREFNADPLQRVAIITGAGEKAFCSGFDLGVMADNIAGGTALPISHEPDLCGVGKSEKPVIAAVNGLAVAGGMELALCCDLRIAVEEAWFAMMEPSRGFLAGVAVNLLPRLVPFGLAADLLLSAERMSVAEAHKVGLVQKVTTRADLLPAAMAKAHSIARLSPTAVWGTKKVIRYWRDLQLSEQQRYYEAVVHRVLLSGDFMEGARAFVEKREPRFNSGWPNPLDAPRTPEGDTSA